MSAPVPSFNSTEMLKQYMAGEHAALADHFISILGHFHNNTFYALTDAEAHFINCFVKNFLFIFTQADFRIEERHVEPFIRMNRTISNLVYLTDQRTTDHHIVLLRDQPKNLAKILTLLSARNTVKFDRKVFFDVAPEMASLWYLVYSYIFYPGLVTKTSYENLREHFQFTHPKLRILSEIQEVYFGATYAGEDQDRQVKGIVNKSMRELIARRPPIRNNPQCNKIAVLSSCWFPSHSVYRNYAAYVRALKEKYHLTFFQLGRFSNTTDTSMFDESHVIDIVNGFPDTSRLQDNDFAAAYFPDIGMSPHSIFLANCRIAPVQFCSPGHSVSTFGADIDYYFTGADVEPENPQRNYSEKVVLLPGMGVIHEKPLYTPRGRQRKDNAIIVNCPWTCQKISYPFVETLKKINAAAGVPFKYRMFIGSSAIRQNDFLPFYKDITDALPNAEVMQNLDYQAYMALMEEGDFTLDSFHFGGCNVVSDSLYLRIPIVTWEGDRWYNRIGSTMLHKVGMILDRACRLGSEELRYIDTALAFLVEGSYSREESRQKLVKADLSTLYDTSDAKYFVKAVDMILADPSLKHQPGPVRIERG